MDQLLIDGTDGALPSRTLSSLLSSSATILSIRPPLVFPSTSSSRYCLPLLCFAFVAFRCLSCKFPPGKSVQAGGTMMHDDRGESEFGRSAQVQIRFLRVSFCSEMKCSFFFSQSRTQRGRVNHNMVLSGTCSACGAHSSSLRRCQGLCGGSHAAWAILRCTDDGKNMHPFCHVGGIFLKEFAKYLEDDPELVEIEYSTSINEDGDEKFKRSCNLPRAAVERAKVDSDFDHGLSHSVALAYDDELLAAARANHVKCDCGSDEPVTKIFHCPMIKAFPGTYSLVDIFAKPCCSNSECMQKIKGDVMDFHQGLAQTMREMGVPTG